MKCYPQERFYERFLLVFLFTKLQTVNRGLFFYFYFARSPTKDEPPTNQSWMGYFGKALMTPASYLPSQVTEVFSQGRAFAIAKLPHAG